MIQALQKENECPKVVVKKVVHAKPERIFDAWTKPELLSQWFFPPGGKAKSSNELRVGGKYQHDMILRPEQEKCASSVDIAPERICEDGSAVYPHYGEYLEIDAPRKLVFTWNSPAVQDSRVTVEFKEIAEGTEITITHELLHTEELRKSHTGGWGECLGSLAEFIVR